MINNVHGVIFGIVMEKEIQSLRLQLEQIDQENKRLRDLLVNMSKDNSVVKSTYVQYNYSYNAPIDMIEETRILILVRPRAVLKQELELWTVGDKLQFYERGSAHGNMSSHWLIDMGILNSPQ